MTVSVAECLLCVCVLIRHVRCVGSECLHLCVVKQYYRVKLEVQQVNCE